MYSGPTIATLPDLDIGSCCDACLCACFTRTCFISPVEFLSITQGQLAVLGVHAQHERDALDLLPALSAVRPDCS